MRVRQSWYQVGENRIGHARVYDVRDGSERERDVLWTRTHDVLFELVLCEHQDLGISSKALYCSQVSCALLLELGA